MLAKIYRKYRIQILLFIIVLLPYLAMTSGNFWETDGQTIYHTAKNIIDHGSLAIDCYTESAKLDNLCYSKYGLFASVSVIPMYLLDKTALEVFHSTYFFPGFFSSLTNCFISALLVVLIYQYLQQLKFSQKYSLAGALLLGFGTYLPVYTKTLFSEPLITLLLYTAFYLLLFKNLSIRNLLLAGSLLGLTFLTKFGVLVLLPCLIYLIWFKKIDRNKIIYLGLPLLAALCIFFFYNYTRLGSPFDTGYRGDSLSTPILYGLYLNLFSSGKSLFLYQPVIIFAFWGFTRFFHLHRLIFGLFLIMLAIYILFYAAFNSPTGDLTWGTRYLYTTLPFFAIGLTYFLKCNKKAVLWWLFGLSLVISIIIQISAVYLSNHRYRSFLNIKYGYNNSNRVAYFDPFSSPLLGQWKMIFRLGYTTEDRAAWREAFQEYPAFNTEYKIAPPDLFLVRSKREALILTFFMFCELFFTLKLIQILKIPRNYLTR